MLQYRQGKLYFRGCDVGELAASFETPFFVLSEEQILRNFEAIEFGLEAAELPFALRYRVAANHELAVLESLSALGVDCLSSHATESELAISAGFQASRIWYQRPIFDVADLEVHLCLGGGPVELFRAGDVEPIERLAAGLGRSCELCLRLRPPRRLIRSFGTSARDLGLRVEEAMNVVRRCLISRHLRVAALSVDLGTQQTLPECYYGALGQLLHLVRRVERELGYRIGEVNLGGGLPSPWLERLTVGGLWRRWRDPFTLPGGETGGFLAEFGRRVAAHAADLCEELGMEPPRLAFEPGRALVGNAGVLVTRVRAASRRWLYVDASRNTLADSNPLLRRLILPLALHPGRRPRLYHLSGSTMRPDDVLDRRRRLPAPEIGEALAICDAGAYSISSARSGGALRPAMYMLTREGICRPIRRAETLEDLTAAMRRRETVAARAC